MFKVHGDTNLTPFPFRGTLDLALVTSFTETRSWQTRNNVEKFIYGFEFVSPAKLSYSRRINQNKPPIVDLLLVCYFLVAAKISRDVV